MRWSPADSSIAPSGAPICRRSATGWWSAAGPTRTRRRLSTSCRGAVRSRGRWPASSPTSRWSRPTSTSCSWSPRSTPTSASGGVERYLLLAREGGATPVVLLTKPDLCDDVPRLVAEVATVAGETPVHLVGPLSGFGMEHVAAYAGAAAHLRAVGIVRRGQEHHRQLAGRPGRAQDAERARQRREGTAHDHASRADPDPHWRAADRHARDARGPAVGRRQRRRADLRGRGSAGGDVPFHRLPASRRAALRRQGRGRGGAARRVTPGELSPSPGRAAAPGVPGRTCARAWRTSAMSKIANKALSQKLRLKGAKNG